MLGTLKFWSTILEVWTNHQFLAIVSASLYEQGHLGYQVWYNEYQFTNRAAWTISVQKGTFHVIYLVWSLSGCFQWVRMARRENVLFVGKYVRKLLSCSAIGKIRKSFPFVILEKQQTVKEAVESQGEKERIPKIWITLKAQEHPIHLARFPCTKRWFKRRKQIMDQCSTMVL